MNKQLLKPRHVVVAWLALLMIGIAVQSSWAANLAVIQVARTVTGTVSDATGNGIPGVSVGRKGTSKGTNTDAKGKFSLEVNDGDVLVFSSVGFKAQEVKVGSQAIINVTLTEDAQSLSPRDTAVSQGH